MPRPCPPLVPRPVARPRHRRAGGAGVRPRPVAAAAAPVRQLDVYDRSSGETLSVHAKDGRSYVVGTPGHEYALRIRNTTGGRVLAVTSVDGVNVITRRDRIARPVGLRARAVGHGRDRRLAQEPRSHRRLLFHGALAELRGAHRPSVQRRRDRRRRVRGEASRDLPHRGAEARVARRRRTPTLRQPRRRRRQGPMPPGAPPRPHPARRRRSRRRSSAPVTAARKPPWSAASRSSAPRPSRGR